MDIFFLTLNQTAMMFTLIAIGFILRKAKILPESSNITMSRLETYVFVPALSFSNMMDKATVSTLIENASLTLYGAIIGLVAVLISYPISSLLIKNKENSLSLDYQKCIYRYAITFGNFGFMGNFIVLGIWGAEGYFKYSMFTFFISLLCNSWGLIMLIPKSSANPSIASTLKKGLLSVPMLAIFFGIIAGLANLKAYFPGFAVTMLDNAASCMGPVSMLLAGFVIGGYNFKELILNKKVYIASFLRLVVIPSIFVLALKAIGVSDEIITFTLIAYATPIGLNTIVFPAAYGGDTKTGASMATISHSLSVITIPLMYLLFVVLL